MLDASPAPLPSGRTLEGRFHVLRPVEPATDAEALWRASHGNPEEAATWEFMSVGPFASPAQMRAWLEELAASPARVAYTVVERATGAPIGGCTFLNVVPVHRCLEIGSIWYVPAHQRSKANTEAAYLLMSEAFDTLRYRRVEWKCDARNTRSRRAALRLGFQHEGLFRQHMIVKGQNRDTAWFSIIDGEWPDVRRRLEAWLYQAPTGAGGRPLGSLSAHTEVTVAAETPQQDEVAALLGELDAYLRDLYPPESNHFLDAGRLAAPDVRFFVARRQGRAVGCGALRVDPSGYGEVKRMYVTPPARGLGAGRGLLAVIEADARRAGLGLLRLEAGVHQPEALALYAAAGFVRRGPFGDYAPDPLSVFMEKALA